MKRKRKWNEKAAERQRRYRQHMRERKLTLKKIMEENSMGRLPYGTRIDPFKLAAFIAYWEIKEQETNRAMRPFTLSELIMTGFEDYVDGLISKYPLIMKQVGDFSTGDCLTFIRNRGYGTPQRGEYRRAVRKVLEDEDLQLDSDTTREEYIVKDHQERFQLSKEILEKTSGTDNSHLTEEQISEARKQAKGYVSDADAQFAEKEARKIAELKKGLDEGPDLSTIVEKKGGD